MNNNDQIIPPNDQILPQTNEENELESARAIDKVLNSLGEKKIFCYCQKLYETADEMIACDFNGCEKEWFHLKCLKSKNYQFKKGFDINNGKKNFVVTFIVTKRFSSRSFSFSLFLIN